MNRKMLAVFSIAVLTGIIMMADAQETPPPEKPAPVYEIKMRIPGEEIKSLRTENMDVHKVSGGKLEARIYSRKQYYYDREESVYKKADLTVREVSDRQDTSRMYDKYVDAGSYRATWFDDKPYDYMFTASEYYITYKALFDTAEIQIELIPCDMGIKENVYLRNAGAATELKWQITTNANVVKGDDGGSFGTCPYDGVAFTDIEGNFLFGIPHPSAWDVNGKPVIVSTTLDSLASTPLGNHVSTPPGNPPDTLTYVITVPAGAEYPVTVDPSTTVDDADNATGYVSNDVTGPYENARNGTGGTLNASYYTPAYVGQYKYTDANYVNYHGFLTFDTPVLPNYITVDSAKVKVVVSGVYNDHNFEPRLVAATTTGTTVVTDWFNLFKGRNLYPTAHSVTYLSNYAPSTSSISPGDTLVYPLNSAGLDSLHIDTYTRFAILSSEDISASPPDDYEFICFEDDSPYIQVWYTNPPVIPPANFTMTALDTTTIACSWDDQSDNEEQFYIINLADSTVVGSLTTNATADTISGLNRNTQYIWAVVADSAGVKGYSDPDSTYTLIPAPTEPEIRIIPVSSDTLKITAEEPANPTSDITGMEVFAVSGSGATGSGWLTGVYLFFDGGINPDSTYVYKVRYRNGEGDSTAWSPNIAYHMNGLDTLTVYLSGDGNDDYNVDFGNGSKDSTVVRVGASDTGQRLDGFLAFELPWDVQKGGVDSMFLSMMRAGEKSEETLTVKLYGIPVEDIEPVEEINPGEQDSTSVTICWTINSGANEKISPDLRSIFQEWQDLSFRQDYHHGFGLRLDDGTQSDGVRAVFLDASHPSYNNGTQLTIYYTPGTADTLDGGPDNFSMTALSPDSIRAEWTDNAHTEYGYLLYNIAESTAVAGADSLAPNTTSVTVGGLKPNTIYRWFVKGYTAYDGLTSSSDSLFTPARVPGLTSVTPLSSTALSFIINPLDNPEYTRFAVQDSISGMYVDGTAFPDTLRPGPLDEWSWRTFTQWGAALGDTLAGLSPDSLYVIRAKARNEE